MQGMKGSVGSQTGAAPIKAKIAYWRGARERGESGLLAPEGWVAFAVYEVRALPDFSAARFPDLSGLDAAQRLQRVAERQGQFITALHALGPQFGFTLRYVYEPPAEGEGRIRLFFVGRAFSETEREAAAALEPLREVIGRAFPAYYRLEERTAADGAWREALGLDGMRSIAEVLKPEQVLQTWHDPAITGFSFYYFPVSFDPGSNSMVEFCQALANGGQERVVVDLCLVPAFRLTPTERDETTAWLRITDRWKSKQQVEMPGGLYSKASTVELAPDPQADKVGKAYADLQSRYGGLDTPLFLYAIRCLWTNPQPPQHLLASLAAHALKPGSGSYLAPVPGDHAAFQKALNAARLCYVTPAVCNEAIWRHPEAPETLRRLHRLADVKEIAGFFRLPVPGREGCPGIPLDAGFVQPVPPSATPSERAPAIAIGAFIERGRITADLAEISPLELTKHLLVVGQPGSGKTTCCFHLLEQAWTQWRVPFLVLEPAKTEYRALRQVRGIAESLLVFTVGNERTAPFRFNPFEVQDGVSVAEHISALNTCFGGAFELWEPLPMVLDEAIRAVYADRGWSEYGVGGDDPDLEPPTLADLYHRALQVAKTKQYRGETAGNLQGALETRIGSLLRGPKGRCFNTRRSVPMEMLMERPVVLELDSLNAEEQALMMMFLLTFVREQAKARRRSGSPLKHLLVVEEAHNVIGRASQVGQAQRGNPKEVAIRFFVNMLAEMRALGEGIAIADQLPTAIAIEAIKNTSIKIMHQLVAADDREELGRAMVFDPAQFGGAATLPVGQSYVFMGGWPRSRLVQEPNFKARHGVESPPTDVEVADGMRDFYRGESIRSIYLPYKGCGEVCETCDPRVREDSERRMRQVWSELQRARAQQPTVEPLVLAAQAFADALPGNASPASDPTSPLRNQCAAVHFADHIVARLQREQARCG